MKKLEICCGSLEDVQIASQFKIDSIELNSALSLGGLTPTISVLKLAKQITTIPLYCMVRPVPGGFIYSKSEFETMLLETKDLLENGADGIVFGCLDEPLTIHPQQTQQMISLIHAYKKEAIFHRAIDITPNCAAAYQQLLTMGIDRVLSSGGQVTACQGLETLKKMYCINPDKLLVGVGIHPDNIELFKEFNYVHASCKELIYRCNGNEQVNYDYLEPNTARQVSAAGVKKLVELFKD